MIDKNLHNVIIVIIACVDRHTVLYYLCYNIPSETMHTIYSIIINIRLMTLLILVVVNLMYVHVHVVVHV